MRFLFLSSILLMFLALPQISSADYSTSGTVSGPYPYTYTVKCVPGDTFTVSVASDYATSVDILSMTPDSRASGGWAVNSVASSRKRTVHGLKYTAPEGKPVNNATHWHYKISILASTEELTKFSLRVTQQGTRDKQDPEYLTKARKKLEQLGVALEKRKAQLKLEMNNQMKRVKILDDALEIESSKIEAERAELITMENNIEHETNEAVRSSIAQNYERRLEKFNVRVRAHNKATEDRNKLLCLEMNKFMEPLKEFQALEKALIQAVEKGDFDKCVLIANGSNLAKSLGWQVMKRR